MSLSDTVSTARTPSMEQRGEHRQRCFKAAHLSFADRTTTLDAIVRDQTASGVRISLADVAPLPGMLIIQVGQTAKAQLARKIWQRGLQAGFTFNA